MSKKLSIFDWPLPNTEHSTLVRFGAAEPLNDIHAIEADPNNHDKKTKQHTCIQISPRIGVWLLSILLKVDEENILQFNVGDAERSIVISPMHNVKNDEYAKLLDALETFIAAARIKLGIYK